MTVENIREEIVENPVEVKCRKICNQVLRIALADHTLPLNELPYLIEKAVVILAGSKELQDVLAKPDPRQKQFRALAGECLEHVLKKTYEIDLAEWRKKHRVGPTDEEELQRGKNLTEFVSLTRRSDLTKKQALNLTDTMLESQFPVDMWNGNEVMNDLVTNFVFWALDNDAHFTKIHKLVIYLIVYRGFDEEFITKRVERFGIQDGVDYGITPEAVQLAYDEAMRIFRQHGKVLLNRFLRHADLDSNSNKNLIPNYRQIVEERSAAIRDNQKELLNVESLESMDVKRIALPDTALDLCLSDIDFALLRRGNRTARNRALVRFQRLIHKMVYNGQYGRGVILHHGVSADFNDIIQEVSRECLRSFSCVSVAKGACFAYIERRIKRFIEREAYGLETLPLSPDIYEKMRYMEKNPNASDEEVSAHYRDDCCTPGRIAGIRASFFCGERPIHRKTCIDEPIGDDSDETCGNFLKELSVPADALDRAEQKEIQGLSHAAVAELPPYHRFLLEQYFIRGKIYEEIATIIGVKPQAVQPIISKAVARLTNGDREQDVDDAADFNLKRDVIVVKNKGNFGGWCLRQGYDEQTRDAFKAYLGLHRKVGFRRLKGREIYKYLERETGHPIEAQDRVRISMAVNDLREKLRRKLLSVTPEERFMNIIPERVMYGRARKHIQRLRDGNALA